MISGPLTLLAIGFLLGFRHAFEPDHLAAVSTLATRQGAVRQAARLGVAWGAGHTVSVAVVALGLILAGWRLPANLQPVADLLVAMLLIGLGGSALIRHDHRHLAARDARQSFGFGIAHGLAGSGAVVVVMVAAAATRGAQLGYLAAFGLGTTAGMLGVSAAVAAATEAAGRRGRWGTWIQLGTAGASVVIGIRLGAECLALLG